MEKNIRSARVSDAGAVRDIYGPSVSDSAASFEVVVPDTAEIERRILDLGGRYPWLVFEGDGNVLGYAYASPHRTRWAYRWSVDVSAYTRSGMRGRGIGRALYHALFDLLRRQGYVNAYAGITLPNAASVRLHEALGFTPVGTYSRIGFKFGSWHDVAWYELRLRDDPVPVPELVPAKLLLGEGGNAALLREYAQMVRLE